MIDLTNNRVFIIAAMGNAHEGDPESAIAIIEAAARSGADAVKFQLFTAAELAIPSFSYYDIYKQYEMSSGAWGALVDHAHNLNLQVFTDVYGLSSMELAKLLGVDGLKIQIADVPNVPLTKRVGAFGSPILLSLAGSTWGETAAAIATLETAGAESIIIMLGFPGYPTELSNSYSERIQMLRTKSALPVGFASHVDAESSQAIMLPIGAMAAGVDVIEEHITLDRSKKGSDYYPSLEPEQFTQMVKLLRAMESAREGHPPEILVDDEETRLKHGRWVVATRYIGAGEKFSFENVALLRTDNPPSGYPLSLGRVIGRIAGNSVAMHSVICLEDL